MKYCAQCGAELEDNARFCTLCGRSVEGDINKVNSDVDLSEKEVEADVSIAKTASAKSTDLDNGSNDKAAAEEDLVDASAQADKAIEVGKGAVEKPKAVAAAEITHAVVGVDGGAESAVAETTESAQSANFKAAMDSSKRKSKRKIPMVVLVAIITMLTAGVAFAAYYVYTEVIVPQQEQAAQEAAEQERIEAEQSALEQAEENYASLLDEYRTIQEKYMNFEGEYYGSSGITQTDRDSYPTLAQASKNADELFGTAPRDEIDLGAFDTDMRLWSADSFKYSYIDLNNDGVYELVVTKADNYDEGYTNGQPLGESLFSVYACSDGQIIDLCDAVYRSSFWISEDNKITRAVNSGGAYIYDYSVQTWNGVSLNTDEIISIDRIDEDFDKSNRASLKVVKNGEETTKTITYGEADEVIEDFINRYPAKTDYEWHDL